MRRIFVPSRGTDDWRQLLSDPAKHWKCGHSAMAVADAWETAQGLPREVATVLGEGTELLIAIPEHKVPLPGGSKESQCDVFALVRTGPTTTAVAIEAKVDEPFGERVETWLRSGSTGRRARLAAICELLGLSGTPPASLRYQLFHRTAAAVLESRRFGTDEAAMIIHSFSAGQRWFWRVPRIL